MLKGVFTEAFTTAATKNNPRRRSAVVAALPNKNKPFSSSPSWLRGTTTTATTTTNICADDNEDNDDVVGGGEDDDDGDRGNSSSSTTTKNNNNRNDDNGVRNNNASRDDIIDDATTSKLVRAVIQQRLLNAHVVITSSSSSEDEKITSTKERKETLGSNSHTHKKQQQQQHGESLWYGRLIARVLPKEFVEYDVKKPPCQIDPTLHGLSFSSFFSTEEGNEILKDNDENEDDNDNNCEMKKTSTHSSSSSSSSISSFSSASNYNHNCQTTTTRYMNQHKDNIASMENEDNLIVTIDLYLFRNDNHHHEASSSSLSNNAYNTDKKSNNNNSDCNKKDDNSSTLLHLHMNRDAKEEASRTLRRFEISTSKKIQSTLPIVSGRGKRSTRKKKKKTKMPLNLKAQGVESSSKVFVLQYDDNKGGKRDRNDGEKGEEKQQQQEQQLSTAMTRKELDIANLTSANLWREIASIHESSSDSSTGQTSKVIVSLHVPDLTTSPPPSKNNDNKNEEEDDDDDEIMMEIPIQVISCPPTILSVQTFENFNARIYTSVPLVIETNLLYATHAVVIWYADGVIVKRDSHCYTPTVEDVGKELCVVIIPVRPTGLDDFKGYEEAYKFKNKVEQLPFMPIVSPIRDDWIHHRRKRSVCGGGDADEEGGEMHLSSSNDLRVLTYNILADLYTSRDIDQHLMYAHCDLEHLMRWRRMPMLIAEILAYDADLICLQEVDAMIFDTLLRPVLGANGYQGYYSNKASTQMEGCAMFWSLDCFEMTKEKDMHTFSIRDLFGEEGGDVQSKDEQSEEGKTGNNNADITHGSKSSECSAGKGRRSLQKWDSMHAISNLMGEHEELRRVAKEKVGQIAQVATLTLKKGVASSFSSSRPFVNFQRRSSSRLTDKPEKIVVANTHLFYHPMADHIRAMQAYAICKKIDHMRRKGPASYPYPLVFCGDLNSNPMSGAVQLLFTRSLLPEHHECWKHLNDYVWEMGDNEYMIEHGYVGNEAQLEEGVEPTYMEEAFDDAHQDANSLSGESVAGDTVHPPAIILPPSFPNLVSGCPDLPNFTNYAVDFVETLDYVLASEPSKTEPYGFGPKSAAPMPSEEDVRRYVAMPNEFMPSDHVSVVCDLEWKTNGFLNGMNGV